MATSTTKLLLRKPDVTDLVDVLEDLNENFDKIDANAEVRPLSDRNKVSFVATNQTRTNAAYGALATAQSLVFTPGPSGMVKITVSCGAGSAGASGSAIMSFALSGGNVRAAGDAEGVGTLFAPTANTSIYASRTTLLTGLAEVATTVTALFRSGGADVASFVNRYLIVEVL